MHGNPVGNFGRNQPIELALIMPEVFENGRHTKLNAETVKLIRKDREETNLSYDKLAEKYGISKGTIADIIKKRTWKDV